MKIAQITEFKGIADDRLAPRAGEFAITKHFDVLSRPRRLQPLRGLVADASNTGIGNMIIAPSDGILYAIGVDYPNNPTLGQLYYRDWSGNNNFAVFSTPQLAGVAAVYDFLVDYIACGNVRTLHWAATNTLVASGPSTTVASASTHALTFTSIGQGLVHPKDQLLYIPYRTGSAQYIAVVSPNAGSYGAISPTALSLPFQYRAYCLSWYGNYLAIPQTTTTGTTQQASLVYLWGRDTSVTTLDDTIPWGDGNLQVLNNLGGALIGVSTVSPASSALDYDAIAIKVWNGGAEPTTVATLRATHIPSAGRPACTINPRVNFIHNDRLYFSVTIDPNDGVQPIRTGLYSVGKNKIDGAYSVVLERMATDTGTETSIIAASVIGDNMTMVHTAVGTVVHNTNATGTSAFTATSVYESGANPGMAETDRYFDKKIYGVRVNHVYLPSGATITLKYRVDSQGADSDWLTVYTQTTAGATSFKTRRAVAAQFTQGRNIEWRIESTGSATITGLAYYYQILENNL